MAEHCGAGGEKPAGGLSVGTRPAKETTSWDNVLLGLGRRIAKGPFQMLGKTLEELSAPDPDKGTPREKKPTRMPLTMPPQQLRLRG